MQGFQILLLCTSILLIFISFRHESKFNQYDSLTGSFDSHEKRRLTTIFEMIGSEAGIERPPKKKLLKHINATHKNDSFESLMSKLDSPRAKELITKIKRLELELQLAKEELIQLSQQPQQQPQEQQQQGQQQHNIEQIPLVSIHSVSPQNTSQDDYAGPYYYMYDLPEPFWWRWPKEQTDCSENGYVGHEHALLSGIGPPIIPENGLFLTWHFSLFSSLYNRIKRSKRRTFDPSKADLFIIPYDLALDGYLNADTCTHRRSCSHNMVQNLRVELKKLPYFARHQGADHAVLWSLGQYHPWPHNQCDVFMKDDCEKCTFTCYWMDPTKKDNRFVSIPFPSSYHWWDGIQNIPWSYNVSHPRPLKAVYLGSTQTLNPHHTKIRRAMTTQCNVSSECHWMQIAHSSKDSQIGDFLSIYRKATFCLCPPGDDPARKAVFDSILSGCIPVIFEVATLFNQYPWHLGEKHSLDIAVSIPGGMVKSGKLDFMKILLSISEETIRQKQIAISRLAHRIQYAIPPIKDLENRFDSTPWDPPYKDGVEILIDGLFQRVKDIQLNQSTHIPERFMTGREWSSEYDVVKIIVPNEREYNINTAVQTKEDMYSLIGGRPYPTSVTPNTAVSQPQSDSSSIPSTSSSMTDTSSTLTTSFSIPQQTLRREVVVGGERAGIDHGGTVGGTEAGTEIRTGTGVGRESGVMTEMMRKESERKDNQGGWKDWDGWGKLSKGGPGTIHHPRAHAQPP